MSDAALANARATQEAIDAALPERAAETPGAAPLATVKAPVPTPIADPILAKTTVADEPLVEPEPDAEALHPHAGDPDARTLPELAQHVIRRPPLLDPGWLWLLAGLTLIAFTIIIPAQRDLEEARFYRDRVLAAEDHRQERLARYQNYLDALERGDESLLLSLAAMQLNKAPKGTDLLVPGYEISKRSASVFTALEPPPLKLPERTQRQQSMLEKWTSDDRSRLWLLGGGSLMILFGLLPAATRRG